MGHCSPWHLQQSAQDSLLARTSQTSMKLQAEPLPSIMFVLWMQPARTLCSQKLLSTIPSVLWVETSRSVTKINFNDQAAVLNTSYMTDNTIIVTVPKNIPGKVTDKIYFITNNKDTLDYNFKTVVPAPTINGMSNEWAAPGEEVTINGDYFLITQIVI